MGRRSPAVFFASILFTAIAGPQTACAQGPAETPPTRLVFDTSDYCWIEEESAALPPLAPLHSVFVAPGHADRVRVADDSFASWLRGLPVRTDRHHVLSHEGRPLAAHSAGVIFLDLGAGDLQQCADTLIRLHAEYLWYRGDASSAVYHFTSGDLSTWMDWVAGVRWAPRGQGVEKVAGEPRDDDHRSYRRWLQRLFVYAGTMSMSMDSVPVSNRDPIQPGDFFVSPGSPGHTVMVLDVAVGGDGSRYGLIGQGFTPAQELHVLSGSDGNVWFPLPAGPAEFLDVPSWNPFPRSTARRFTEPTVEIVEN